MKGKSKVYFAQARTGEIKIGVSVQVHKRVQDISQNHPYELTLVGYMDGNSRLERQCHVALDKHRLRGEWFKNNNEVRETIEGWLSDKGMGPHWVSSFENSEKIMCQYG